MLTKMNILDYITKLLLESEYYIRFSSIKEKEQFINYIWKSYEDYITYSNTIQYKKKYMPYFDDQIGLNDKSYLFIDATEYIFSNKILFLDINHARNHWLLRIGNGNNFKNSSKFNIWGVKQTTNTKFFEKIAKPGDILWFIVSKNNGQSIGFAEYINHNERTKTNEELGWEYDSNSNDWTIEINYKNLKNIEDGNYCTFIVGQNVNIRLYNDKCKINLPHLFEKIMAQTCK